MGDDLEAFAQQQMQLREKVIAYDTEAWQKYKFIAVDDAVEESNALRYVAGLDISYLKSEPDTACVAIVVCQLPNSQVVYEDCQMVQCTAKYVAGYLATREAPFLIDAYRRLEEKCPQYLPQLSALLIDGNGVLHPNGCGIACMVGIELNVPTIGVAKNLLFVDGIGKDDQHKSLIKSLTKKGDSFPLIGSSGRVWGLAVRSCDEAVNPVYVSVGHKISLESAGWVVTATARHRVPQPIRQADLLSREFLRKAFPDRE